MTCLPGPCGAWRAGKWLQARRAGDLVHYARGKLPAGNVTLSHHQVGRLTCDNRRSAPVQPCSGDSKVRCITG